MLTSSTANPRPQLAIAIGRSIGAVFFAVFGTLWLTTALFALRRLHWPSFLALVAVACVAVVIALQLLARIRRSQALPPPGAQQKRDDRVFGWINAGQGLAIFLLFYLLPRFGQQDKALPAVVIVVGLHFLVMPPSYRYRSNSVLGVAMALWGVFCMVAFRGDRMIAFAALGAGLMLWSLAAWALHTAISILRRHAH